MATDFILPPDTRIAGEGNPPLDMDAVIDALQATGASYNVLNGAYAGGGDPTGASDSTAALQAALNALGSGQAAAIPPGVYQVTAPLTVPANAGLRSAIHGSQVLASPPAGVILKPSAGFTGSAVINMNTGSELYGISIDGSNLPAGSVVGVEGAGAVGCVLEYCFIYKPTGVGIDASSSSRGWHVSHCRVDSAGGNGIQIANHTDSLWFDVQVINCTGHGWSIGGSPCNSRFVACRAEWNGQVTGGKDGFHLNSAWGTGTGSGGCTFVGCSTDRNDNNGFGITCTGTVPIILSGCMMRRDGRNLGSGGGGFAGLNLNGATCPVIVNGCSVFPGVDDTGSGTDSPQYGISLTGSSSARIISGYYQGDTQGLIRSGNSNCAIDPRNVEFASGNTASPSVSGSPVSQVNQTEVDVTNTTTETTVISLTLPTGLTGGGTQFRINIMGVITNIATSGSLTFRLYLGANSQSITVSSMANAASGVAFFLEAYCTVRSAGSSGTFIVNGRGEIENATARVNISSGNTATATVDTTQANPVIKLTAQWATANASNSLQVTQAVIEPVNV